MRPFHHRPSLSRASTGSVHAPVRAAETVQGHDTKAMPEHERALDEAAALWTTRRIRCYLVMQPATCGTRGR